MCNCSPIEADARLHIVINSKETRVIPLVNENNALSLPREQLCILEHVNYKANTCMQHETHIVKITKHMQLSVKKKAKTVQQS